MIVQVGTLLDDTTSSEITTTDQIETNRLIINAQGNFLIVNGQGDLLLWS